MTIAELKAFVEGLEHGFVDGAPSPEQWALIKKKLDGVYEPLLPTSTRRKLDDIIGPGTIPWYGDQITCQLLTH